MQRERKVLIIFEIFSILENIKPIVSYPLTTQQAEQ